MVKKGTKKLKEAKSKSIPTVHFTWLTFSLIYLLPLSVDFFDVVLITEERLEHIDQFEKEMIDHHTDM